MLPLICTMFQFPYSDTEAYTFQTDRYYTHMIYIPNPGQESETIIYTIHSGAKSDYYIIYRRVDR